MANLYELTNNFKQVYEMDDLEAEIWIDTLESIECDFEEKAENYGRIIRNYESETDALENEIKRLKSKKTVLTNKVSRMKGLLEESMLLTGKTKFKTTLFNFGIQNNPPSVDVEDLNKIPSKYLNVQLPIPDKKAILQDLKNGKKIPGVKITQKSGLRMR